MTVTSTPAGIACALTNGVGSGACSAEFVNGTSVTLTATASALAPAAGSTLDGWSGDGAGASTRTVVLDANRAVVATFKANQTIAFETLAGRTYGDADFSVSPTASSGLSVTVSSQTMAVCSTTGTTVRIHTVGSCTLRASQSGDAGFNAAADTDRTLIVSAATLTIKADAASRAYGQANPSFSGAVVSGAKSGDTFTVTASSVATTTTPVGMYDIVPDVAGVALGNYTVVRQNGTLSVTPAPATITAKNKSRTYGAANPPLDADVTGTLTGDVLNYTVATTATETSGVGNYPIVVTLGSNPNYDVTSTNGTLVISRAAATVTANDKSRTYGAANPTFDAAVGGTLNADVLAYSLTTLATEASGVGSHTIVVTLGSNPNYDVTPTNGTLVISRAAATVTANDKSRTYGAANPTFDAAIGGTLNGDVLNYSLATLATETSGVGSYPIVVTLGSNPNYDVSTSSGTLVITRAAASVTANDKSRTYGAANPTFDAAVGGTLNGDVLDYSLATLATETSGVGSYPIVVTLGSNPNYDVSTSSGTLVITRTAATVTANDRSRTYGFVNPTFDAAVTGALNGDVLNYTLATAATETSGVGSYPIAVTLGANPNYDVTPTNGTLVVTRAAATVTANDKSRTYGATNPAFDAAVTGALNGDVLAYSLATVATETSSVGSYPIVVTLGSNPNYDVTPTSGALVITRAAATVTANDKSRTYGAANPTFDAAVNGALNGDVLAYTLATVATETTSVGSYPIVVTLGANPNYAVTITNGTLNVTLRAITVTADPKSKVLDAADPALTYRVTNGSLVAGDALTGALARATGEAIGLYAITQGTVAASANYALTFVPNSLRIVYANGGTCLGQPGHAMLQPINADGSSVFKQGSTVPAKFRVCDANGVSIGRAGVVTSFRLVQTMNGTVDATVNEPVVSTTPDAQFRWSSSDQQWIFNINTRSVKASLTYAYEITLDDGSSISFRFGLK